MKNEIMIEVKEIEGIDERGNEIVINQYWMSFDGDYGDVMKKLNPVISQWQPGSVTNE